MQPRVYLDHAASTPLDTRVVEAMEPYFNAIFANPASSHLPGQKAESAVETAREQIAAILDCSPSEIVFTSGGTESDNLALRGAALAARAQRGAHHILITPLEHAAVAKTAQHLRDLFDFELEYIPVDHHGLVDPDRLAALIRPTTAVVSIIHANNEIGTINPIAELGAVCRERAIPFHSDGVQAVAHMPVSLSTLPADLYSIGAHKFNGPKGVGALFVRSGTPLTPIQTGGGQENDRRSGTLNVPYIVGMAAALQLVHDELEQRRSHVTALRDRIIERVLSHVPLSRLSGHPLHRLPNHASFVFENLDGNRLLAALDVNGFSCSSASACKVGRPEPSEVLLALGLTPAEALSSLRVTVSHMTLPGQVDRFLEILPAVIQDCRTEEVSPEPA